MTNKTYILLILCRWLRRGSRTADGSIYPFIYIEAQPIDSNSEQRQSSKVPCFKKTAQRKHILCIDVQQRITACRYVFLICSMPYIQVSTCPHSWLQLGILQPSSPRLPRIQLNALLLFNASLENQQSTCDPTEILGNGQPDAANTACVTTEKCLHLLQTS